MTTSPFLTIYPCDRGVQGGPRGYHHFQLLTGGTCPVCVLCGKVATPGGLTTTTAPHTLKEHQ